METAYLYFKDYTSPSCEFSSSRQVNLSTVKLFTSTIEAPTILLGTTSFLLEICAGKVMSIDIPDALPWKLPTEPCSQVVCSLKEGQENVVFLSANVCIFKLDLRTKVIELIAKTYGRIDALL
jgi:hypothetical protein